MQTRQNRRKSAISKKNRHLKYTIGTGQDKDYVYSLSFSATIELNSIIVSFSMDKKRLPEIIYFTISEFKQSGIINERALSQFVEKKLRK